MRKLPFLILALAVLSGCMSSSEAQLSDLEQTGSIHNFVVEDIYGDSFDLATLAGRKVMVVNTASECGFTPQFAQLEELYQSYKDRGLVVIGFPTNDFLDQDPGDNKKILEFCQENYGVTFPMMAKVTTKGSEKSELYRWLTEKSANGVVDAPVQWNFQKFLIDEDGSIFQVLAPTVEPNDPAVISWLEEDRV